MAYSEAQKAEALAVLAANGNNLAKTSRDLKLPYTTLRQWRNGTGVNADVTKSSEVKKKALADELEALAYKLVKAMPGKMSDATLQQLATSLGITVEKMLLLRGEATGNDTLKISVEYADPNGPTP